MITLYSLLWQILNIYAYVIIAYVIFGWLQNFGIIDSSNKIVYTIGDILYRFSEPSLSFIRRFLPSLAGLDLSPVVVLMIVYVLQGLLQEYFLPILLH